jgi:hypothetical protein
LQVFLKDVLRSRRFGRVRVLLELETGFLRVGRLRNAFRIIFFVDFDQFVHFLDFLLSLLEKGILAVKFLEN